MTHIHVCTAVPWHHARIGQVYWQAVKPSTILDRISRILSDISYGVGHGGGMSPASPTDYIAGLCTYTLHDTLLFMNTQLLQGTLQGSYIHHCWWQHYRGPCRAPTYTTADGNTTGDLAGLLHTPLLMATLQGTLQGSYIHHCWWQHYSSITV